MSGEQGIDSHHQQLLMNKRLCKFKKLFSKFEKSLIMMGFNETSNKNLTSESNNVIFEISLKNVPYFSTVVV